MSAHKSINEGLKKVYESSPEARKAAISAVQNSYQEIAYDLIAGYGDDLDAMSALDSVVGNLEMNGDRETVAYIRSLGSDLPAFAKEALGNWEGISG